MANLKGMAHLEVRYVAALKGVANSEGQVWLIPRACTGRSSRGD